jgi:tRNA A37 threonylcarbamoyladenosine dehydratase
MMATRFMWKDPIVEEIRANWNKYASRFNHSLPAIFADLKKKEKKDRHSCVYPQSQQRTASAVAESKSDYGSRTK